MNFLFGMRSARVELLGDMAKKLGISSSDLSAYETGRKKLPPHVFKKIVDIYKLNFEESCRMSVAMEETMKLRKQQRKSEIVLTNYGGELE